MPLRLVDGGIPSFEWKRKRVENPFTDDEIFELRKKVELGELVEDEAFRKRYKLIDDADANLELYRKILTKIPPMPGKLVICTITDFKFKIHGFYSSDLDLREGFKHSLKTVDGCQIDRFSWLKKLALENGVSSVSFLLGRED